jgi:hypothetical protein
MKKSQVEEIVQAIQDGSMSDEDLFKIEEAIELRNRSDEPECCGLMREDPECGTCGFEELCRQKFNLPDDEQGLPECFGIGPVDSVCETCEVLLSCRTYRPSQDTAIN